MVEAVRLAGEDGAEIEPEPVDVHLGDPVPQAVGHHLHHARVTEVQRVAGAGVVDVVARLVRHHPVVRRVVDALERQRRPPLVAFRRVVVDDVENDLEAGVVEPRHHLLEFLQAARAVGRVARVGREEADAVVAPVIREPLLDQIAVVDEGVDGQELDRADAQRLDVVDHLFDGQARERALLVRRHRRMALGVSAHVRLVKDRPVPRDVRPPRLLMPVEVRIDDDRLRHERGAVALVERQIVALGADRVPEARRVPLELADVRARVRIEQQLVRVEPVAGVGRVRPVDAVSVDGARPDVGDVAVPDLVGEFGQLDSRRLAIALPVEEAHFHFRRVRGEQREVDALAVPAGAARVRLAFADGMCIDGGHVARGQRCGGSSHTRSVPAPTFPADRGSPLREGRLPGPAQRGSGRQHRAEPGRVRRWRASKSIRTIAAESNT